jgi:hypothetical protein
MATLVPVSLGDSTIYIEASGSATVRGTAPIQEAGAGEALERAVDTAQQLTESVRSCCKQIIESMRSIGEDKRPTRASVEFGLDISLEGNFYVVKGTGGGSIRITAEWELAS